MPVVDWTLDSRAATTPFLFLVIAGAANGANLTDGIDGLAAGTSVIIALLTFLAIDVIALASARATRAPAATTYLDLAILGAALIGGAIGFLWYNAFPAEVFMGDTGSMALGGAHRRLRDRDRHRVLLLADRRHLRHRGALA